MNDTSHEIDRQILSSEDSFWTDDPENSMTEADVDRILGFFAMPGKGPVLDLRKELKMLFQSFFEMALKESVREQNGFYTKARKPSSIVENEVMQLKKTCVALSTQLSDLDVTTETWLRQALEASGLEVDLGRPMSLELLQNRAFALLPETLMLSQLCEGITSPGASNTALRDMIERLASLWEVSHGTPPTTDKGRGRREDPFLNLCQDMALTANRKLKEKGGQLRSLALSGLVDDVLKRRQEALRKSGEK